MSTVAPIIPKHGLERLLAKDSSHRQSRHDKKGGRKKNNVLSQAANLDLAAGLPENNSQQPTSPEGARGRIIDVFAT